MNKIHSLPTLEQARKEDSNSINQIVLQLHKHLPQYGWEICDDPQDVQLVAAHAGQTFGEFPCDIAHCHGLYPTFHFKEPKWHFAANENVIQNLRYAKAITVPSQWVGDIIRRELNREPIVVNWAIDAAQWQYQTAHKGYTLWNKTRMDSVCDPSPIEYLAKELSDSRFVTTFAQTQYPNLDIIGRKVFSEMQTIIQDASLYLATTKETFGIGTLEAMACGVPVLGYDWGGTSDIVEHGLEGYLVEPGDLEGLKRGWLWCMKHRQLLKAHARKKALSPHYRWQRVAMQFANLYDEVLLYKQSTDEIKASVVIPCWNYAHFLPLAIESVLHQETDFKFELIVIDDGSNDESLQTAYSYQEKAHIPFRVIQQANHGVARTRNAGIRASNGDYIVCLDADDLLGDVHFLQTLANALDADPLLGVAYTGLATFEKDPFAGCYPSQWPTHFNAKLQYEGKNQVPTCCMFRKRAWEQAGGYRHQLQPAEDAGLWYRISLLGWSIRKVSDRPMFFYRYHNASLSAKVRMGSQDEPNWLAIHEAGTSKRYPMAAQLDAKTYSRFPTHPVRNYDQPLFSFIIPVGPGHQEIVHRALDSIWGQIEWRWEVIVINDTPDYLDIKYKWAKVINQAGAITGGAGHARNLGIAYAKGRFAIFLDADDMLKPQFLYETYQLHRATGHYIYSDWWEEKQGILSPYATQTYSQEAIFNRMSIHPITALIPMDWVNDVGGFDETLDAWEDTDLFIKMAIAGFCGQRLPKALMVYNHDSGKRRNLGAKQSEILKAVFRERYNEYFEGHKMAKRCCGDQKPKVRELNINDENVVKVMMVEGGAAPISIRGLATRKAYGRHQKGDIFLMHARDVQAQSNVFKVLADDASVIMVTPDPSPPPELKEV